MKQSSSYSLLVRQQLADQHYHYHFLSVNVMQIKILGFELFVLARSITGHCSLWLKKALRIWYILWMDTYCKERKSYTSFHKGRLNFYSVGHKRYTQCGNISLIDNYITGAVPYKATPGVCLGNVFRFKPVGVTLCPLLPTLRGQREGSSCGHPKVGMMFVCCDVCLFVDVWAQRGVSQYSVVSRRWK